LQGHARPRGKLHGYAVDRATVRQKKTGLPVRFEITEHTIALQPTAGSVESCRRKTVLLDDLIGGGKQIGRHGQAERLGGLEIDQELEFCAAA
jgi:hypothetical protein